MKLFLLALFVATAAAAPAPSPDDGQAVELIVNGVQEGEPLELGNIVNINVKEHADGQLVSSSDLLHPLTAAGIAEAAIAAAEAVEPTPIDFVDQAIVEVPEPAPIEVPSPIELPTPVLPVPVLPVPEKPESVILPAPVLPVPEIPESVKPQPIEPIDLPGPVIPEPVELPPPVNPIVYPEPIVPEPIIPEPVVPAPVPEPVPEPAAQFPQEIFNDGVVQVQVNQEPGVLSTIQSWFNMVVNYFNNGDAVSSHQIV